MNIFVLDESPILAAQAQHDRHVVKMILESAQMLCVSALEFLPESFAHLAYKPTHANHPCNVWVRESNANAGWLILHGSALVAEYHRRFQKYHATYSLIQGFVNGYCKAHSIERMWTRDKNRNLIIDLRVLDLIQDHTLFRFAGPAQYIGESVIDSYQAYYIAEKAPGNRWSNPVYKPDWLLPHMTCHDRFAKPIVPTVKPHVPAGMKIPAFLLNR